MILCLSLAFAVLKILPPTRRNLDNLEEATRNLAEASRNLPETAENVKGISRNLLGASEDVRGATPILKWIALANNVADGVTGTVVERGRMVFQTIRNWFS